MSLINRYHPVQDYAPARETGKLQIAKTTSSTSRDEILEPDSISTSETEQLRPTETDETIVMKSAEPARHAISDDTAKSNKRNHSTELC